MTAAVYGLLSPSRDFNDVLRWAIQTQLDCSRAAAAIVNCTCYLVAPLQAFIVKDLYDRFRCSKILHHEHHSEHHNALGWSTWADEDFIGRVARISRRCHAATVVIRSISKCLTYYKQEWHKLFDLR